MPESREAVIVVRVKGMRSRWALRRRIRIRLNRAHGWLYAHTGGRLGASIGGHRVLLLTTTGRITGEPRRTPVQYETVRGEMLLVAAGGGSSRPPAWWRNIEEDPHVTVQLGGEKRHAVARTIDTEERARLWPELCARNRSLEKLEEAAHRRLPVVRVTMPG